MLEKPVSPIINHSFVVSTVFQKSAHKHSVSIPASEIFNLPNPMNLKFYLFKFHNTFEGLIGLNNLKLLKAEINSSKGILVTPHTKIRLKFHQPFNDLNLITVVPRTEQVVKIKATVSDGEIIIPYQKIHNFQKDSPELTTPAFDFSTPKEPDTESMFVNLDDDSDPFFVQPLLPDTQQEQDNSQPDNDQGNELETVHSNLDQDTTLKVPIVEYAIPMSTKNPRAITLKSLDKNLRLMPIKLGMTKITKMISEVDKVKLKTEKVAKLIRQNFEHYNHSANYLNILYLLERKVTHNQLLLENQIKKLSSDLIETQTYESNSIILRDTITEIIILYQVIISILQDIENSITFAKLGTMQPSIIKPSYLIKALNSIAPKPLAGQLPIEVTLDNIPVFEKLLKISCYTLHRKVIYILHVPIVYASHFEYYHLYSIPIFHKSQFKLVIPSGKYLVKNELHYAFARDKCTEMVPKHYICNEMDLRRIEKTNPCEVQLLESKSPTTCQGVDAVITEPMMKRLNDSRQWILLIPVETAITLSCERGEEVIRVLGSYLAEIPVACTLQLNEDLITDQEPVSIRNQPILFSNIDVNISLSNPKNFSLHLDQAELDEIHKI
nr:unnamed protein product [Callosobruchus chinensis]